MLSPIRAPHCLPGLGFWILVLLTVPALARQTESDGQPKWYKGNLHTHSLWSDGNDFPEMITAWYVDRDYNFLALTDHNVLSQGERWMSLTKIDARGGQNALKKYLAALGDEWVELRDAPVPADNDATQPEATPAVDRQVRLKGLDEYRSKFESPGRFLLLTGEEISDSVDGFPVHMNATNLVELIRPAGGSTVREAMASNLRSAIEQSREQDREIIVHLNHPNFGWAITAEDLAFVLEEKFFEVFNGHPGVGHLGNQDFPSVERLWDIANTIRIDKLNAAPLMGLGTDDCHNYHGRPGSQPGRGWVMVRAMELTPEALMKAMNAGDFYSSSGVVLDDVMFDETGRELKLKIDAPEGVTMTTEFIGTPKDYDSTSTPRKDTNGKPMRATRVYSPDVGKVLATVTGNAPSYKLTGNELYVRAVVTSSQDHPNPAFDGQHQQAWTQAFGWK